MTKSNSVFLVEKKRGPESGCLPRQGQGTACALFGSSAFSLSRTYSPVRLFPGTSITLMLVSRECCGNWRVLLGYHWVLGERKAAAVCGHA